MLSASNKVKLHWSRSLLFVAIWRFCVIVIYFVICTTWAIIHYNDNLVIIDARFIRLHRDLLSHIIIVVLFHVAHANDL